MFKKKSNELVYTGNMRDRILAKYGQDGDWVQPRKWHTPKYFIQTRIYMINERLNRKYAISRGYKVNDLAL